MSCRGITVLIPVLVAACALAPARMAAAPAVSNSLPVTATRSTSGVTVGGGTAEAGHTARAASDEAGGGVGQRKRLALDVHPTMPTSSVLVAFLAAAFGILALILVGEPPAACGVALGLLTVRGRRKRLCVGATPPRLDDLRRSLSKRLLHRPLRGAQAEGRTPERGSSLASSSGRGASGEGAGGERARSGSSTNERHDAPDVAVGELAEPDSRGGTELLLKRHGEGWRPEQLWRRVPVLVLVLCGLSLALWASSIRGIDVDSIGDVGLVSALPARYFLALGLLTTSLIITATANLRARWYALHVAVLIVIIHATLPLLYDVPRFSYVYKHLGVVDLVSRFGSVDRTIDVYNNWPTFFLLNAYFREAAGLSSSNGYAPWAPVFFNLSWCLILLFAYGSLVRDARTRWMGLWLFLLGNWIGQDYLSPQAFGFLLTIAILALSLAWLPRRQVQRWVQVVSERLRALTRRATARATPKSWLAFRKHRPASPEFPARQLPPVGPISAVTLLLIAFSAAVMSHQLTPFTIIIQVTVVLLFARRWPAWLPLVMIAMTVAWFWFVAGTFIETHSALIGDVGHAPSASVEQPIPLSGGQATVSRVSRLLSAAIWLLAGIGLLIRWRRGHRDSVLVALAAAPLALLVTLSYGGEIILRVYLFALPWFALLGGAALAWLCEPRRFRRARFAAPVIAVAVSFTLVLGLLVAGFGQEKANRIHSGEVEAAAWFYNNAPDASLMMLVTGNFPSRLEGNYGRFEVADFLEEARYRNHEFSPTDVPRLVRILNADTETSLLNRNVNTPAKAYVIFSKSQTAYADLYRLASPRQVESLEFVIAGSPLFRLVYANADARIFELKKVIRL